MPTITISRRDLERLVGRRIKDLEDWLGYLKAEIKGRKGDEIEVELKDTNRPDLFSLEGIARGLRDLMGVKKRFKFGEEPILEVRVRGVGIRPYIAAAVVKKVRLSNSSIRSLMHLQEVLDRTVGRNRERTSIGLYNYDLLRPPLYYELGNPNISFVPLGFEREMTLKDILKEHPKGVEYGHIIKGSYPILRDRRKILSFPPIINSNDLGRITTKTKNVLVEVTGTDLKWVEHVLKIVSLSALEWGKELHPVRILYKGRERITPDLSQEEVTLDLLELERLSGFEIKDVERHLRRMGYEVIKKGRRFVKVRVPTYRMDVMHPVDVMEDVLISYGYNRIEPKMPQLPTIGWKDGLTDKFREIGLGMGLEEVQTFIMNSKSFLEDFEVLEVENPMSSSKDCLRSWIYPCHLEFLSMNTHVPYPQKIFEVGEVVQGIKTRRHLCVTLSPSDFTEAKQMLDHVAGRLRFEYELVPQEFPWLIEGRCGKIVVGKKEIGVIGEVHPGKLNELGIFNPVSLFEIDIDSLRRFYDKIRTV